MDDKRGLDQIPVRLTAEQAGVLAAHAQLIQGLAAIKYPKSGRWEDRETAIAVLEVVADYLSVISEEVISHEIVAISSHVEVLEDVITHFRQASWGTIDRRLAPNLEGAAGAAHDDTLFEFKREALSLVRRIAERERAQGKKDHVAEARRLVARAYQDLGLVVHTARNKPPKEVTAKLLESWEKRFDKDRRPRANCP